MPRAQKQHGIRRIAGRKGIKLTDPVQITEDEADFIIGSRREATEPSKPFEQYLAERGYELDRMAPKGSKIRRARAR